MCQCRVRKPAALGHHRAMLAGSGFIQADLRGSHGLGLRVVLVPKRDRAGVVRADVNDAADIPPVPLHALIGAVAAAHLPPAVPLTVPPVEQRVTGFGGSGQSAVVSLVNTRGSYAAECSGIDGDLAVFLTEYLLKGRLDRAGRVVKQICCPNFQCCARSNVCKLAVNHSLKAVIVLEDRSDFQLCAVLHERFIDAPEIRSIFLAVVCEVQRQNNRVISVRILHDARALVEQFIVAELNQIGIFLLFLSAGGEAAEQHQHRKKQA